MISPSIPSNPSRLFCFDGFQMSAASVSSETLLAIRRSTGCPEQPHGPSTRDQ